MSVRIQFSKQYNSPSYVRHCTGGRLSGILYILSGFDGGYVAGALGLFGFAASEPIGEDGRHVGKEVVS